MNYGPWEKFTYYRCHGAVLRGLNRTYSVCQRCGVDAPFLGRKRYLGRRVTQGWRREFVGIEWKLKDGSTWLCRLDSEFKQLLDAKLVTEAW